MADESNGSDTYEFVHDHDAGDQTKLPQPELRAPTTLPSFAQIGTRNVSPPKTSKLPPPPAAVVQSKDGAHNSFSLPPPPSAFTLPPPPPAMSTPLPQPPRANPRLPSPKPTVVNDPNAAVDLVIPKMSQLTSTPLAPPPQIPQPTNIDSGKVETVQPVQPVEQTQEEPASPSWSGWLKSTVSASPLLSKVAETARSGVDTMIVTLDPQMKEYMNASGTAEFAVASDVEAKITGVKEGFAHAFGYVVARGLGAPGSSTTDTIACQPVGFENGELGALERIRLLRSSGLVDDKTPVVAVEGFVVEVMKNRWVEMPCIVIDDRQLNVQLTQFGQPTNVPDDAVEHMKSHTPADYPRAARGFAVPVGGAMGECTHAKVHPCDWHSHTCGIDRKQLIANAARALAFDYKRLLCEKMQ